jgi:hypothetical protein
MPSSSPAMRANRGSKPGISCASSCFLRIRKQGLEMPKRVPYRGESEGWKQVGIRKPRTVKPNVNWDQPHLDRFRNMIRRPAVPVSNQHYSIICSRSSTVLLLLTLLGKGSLENRP